MTITELIAKIGADITGLEAGLAAGRSRIQGFVSDVASKMEAGATAPLAKLGARLTEIGGQARQAGTVMTLALTAPIVALGKQGITAFVEFDKGLRNVDSLAKMSAKEFQGLHDNILKLAQDKMIRQMPTDLAKGMYDVYSSGFSGAKALDILKYSAYGASAGLTDTATSSQVLMAVLNSGIPGVKSAKEAMDVLFREVDLGVNTFEQLASSLGDVLPTAQVARVSLQEVSAALAVMTRGGISASESTTALNQLLIHIIHPTHGAKELMKSLRIEYGLAALQAKGLTGWLKEVEEKTRGNQQSLVEIMPEVRALKAILSLTKNDGKDFNEMLGGMKTATQGAGATMAALERQNKSLAASWDMFKKELQIVEISLGEMLAPALQTIVGWMKTAVEWFGRLPAPVQKGALVVAALSAAIGPLLIVLGSMASGLGAILSLASTLAPLLEGVAAVLTGPLGLAIAAVVAAVVLLYEAWVHNWGGIREKTAAFIEWLKPYLQQAWAWIKTITLKVWGELKDFFLRVWPPIRDVVVTVWNAIVLNTRLTFNLLTALFRGTWNNIAGIFRGVWDVIKGIVKVAWGLVAGIIVVGLKLLTGDWKGAWDSIRHYAAMVWDGIKDIVSGALRAVGNTLVAGVKMFYNIGRDLIMGLVNGIRSGISNVVSAAKDVASSAYHAAMKTLGIESPSKKMMEVGKQTAEGMAAGLRNGQISVSEAARILAQSAHDTVWQGTKGIREMLRNVSDGTKQIFTTAFEDLYRHGFKGFFDKVVQGFQDMLQKMAAEYLASQLTQLFGRGLGALVSAIGGNGQSVADAFGGARAFGGPVESGRAYLVGEQGPEMFVPGQSGKIVSQPAAAAAGGNIVIQMTVYANDANSFRRTEGQIGAELARRLQLHQARNQ